MKAAFLNPPIFTNEGGILKKWVRAGSRWPQSQDALCRPDQWQEGHYICFPMWLAYAASYTQANADCTVILRDSIALHESYGRFYAYCVAENPDIIFIESSTPTWEHDKGVIAGLHERLPQARIAICGPIAHPASGKQPEILALPGVVAAIAGEYEKGCVRVVKGQMGAIPFEALTKDEMNGAPFPWQDAATVWRYHDACPLSPVMPQAQIYASRGCNFSCHFCSFPAVMSNDDPTGTGKRTVRFYTPEYIEAYVRELIAKYRIRSVYFDDDTFNLGNKHVEKLCAVMKRIGLPWSAMCRADTVTRATWELMQNSGCYGVKIGFESGAQEVVDRMGKDLNIAEARKTVIWLRNLGMSVHTTWTLGHPGETRAQMQATMEFIKTVPHNSLQIAGTALLDGTPNAEEDKQGLVDTAFNRTTDGAKKLKEIWAEVAAQ